MPTVLRRFPLLLSAFAVAAAPHAHAQRRPAPRPPSTPRTAVAPRAGAATPEASLRRADLEAHLRFLASDELMGRAPGTPGIDAAARYIAEQFRRFGVQPVPGQGDYYQRFTLTRLSPPAHASVFALGDSARAGANVGIVGGGAFDRDRRRGVRWLRRHARPLRRARGARPHRGGPRRSARPHQPARPARPRRDQATPRRQPWRRGARRTLRERRSVGRAQPLLRTDAHGGRLRRRPAARVG